MVDAIVYIGHGSRTEEGNLQFIRFVKGVMQEIPVEKQAIAFLELTEPTIPEALEKIIQTGAKKILVVPVLLFSALHHKRDIPEEVQAIQALYPTVTFLMSEPFGIHPYMIELVVKRLETVIVERDAAILLVGRGSSDPEPSEKLGEIGRRVEATLNMPVYTAFLTGTPPPFRTALAELEARYKKIYVMPYLLFTGFLLKKIQQIVSESNHNIILSHNLEFDALMKRTLIERIEEKSIG